MFTGLIESTGRIDAVPAATGGRLVVATPLASELSLGESVSVNGVCLTVVAHDAGSFAADVSPVTLSVTSLGRLAPDGVVNLERSLRADARLGGHFVLGHVDATGRLRTIRPDAESYWMEIEVPPAIEPLLILRGSVAVDGISLTVAALEPGWFGVQVIPHTWSHTSLSHATVGSSLNLEADVLGKYVARLSAFPPVSGPVSFS